MDRKLRETSPSMPAAKKRKTGKNPSRGIRDRVKLPKPSLQNTIDSMRERTGTPELTSQSSTSLQSTSQATASQGTLSQASSAGNTIHSLSSLGSMTSEGSQISLGSGGKDIPFVKCDICYTNIK
jgi:hypothetical protein